MNHDFEIEDLERALINCGVKNGDVIWCHNNVGFFGRLKNCDNKEQYADSILRCLMGCIGDNGSIVIPTFTYSAPKNECFDKKILDPSHGVLANRALLTGIGRRTSDPNVSVIVIGKYIPEIENITTYEPYEKDGVFDVLANMKSMKICNLNFDSASTLIHKFEKDLSVDYRFDKVFYSYVIVDKKIKKVRSKLYVNKLSFEGSEADLRYFGRVARDKGVSKEYEVGRGRVAVISIEETRMLVNQLITENKHSLTKFFLSECYES